MGTLHFSNSFRLHCVVGPKHVPVRRLRVVLEAPFEDNFAYKLYHVILSVRNIHYNIWLIELFLFIFLFLLYLFRLYTLFLIRMALIAVFKHTIKRVLVLLPNSTRPRLLLLH